jgi:predicted alpha-1,6-mannanase (GH76 family)
MRSAENRDRNAVSTLNGAILGLRLYALTGRPGYVRWARRMLEWADGCLVRGDGLLADHIALDGARDERAWSYNQGAFVAAAVLLAQATHDSRYLDLAQRKAATALDEYGPAFEGEPRIFVAIFFHDLQLLDAVRPDPRYRAALARYADLQWRRRDSVSGLFVDADGASLLDQAAMVQTYALLAV